jgi:hypothetical protein
LVTTDDFVYGIRDQEDRRRMHQYVLDHGISYRDDSILVDWYITTYSDTFTVRSPEFFADAFKKTPTVFELEHYSGVRRRGNWLAKPGSSLAKFGGGKRGADYFRGALTLLHATYIGYHGPADLWYSENRELTSELLNRCGYWYFLHKAKLPKTWKRGQSQVVEVEWSNRGVAPAYHPYRIMWRLDGPQCVDVALDSGNLQWQPGPKSTYTERYEIPLAPDITPGRYQLRLRLYSPEARRDVFVALKPELRDDHNFYHLTQFTIAK